MAPKQGRGAVAKARAQAKAAAAAALVRKVEKKRQRRVALQALNDLADEVGAGAAQVDPRSPFPAKAWEESRDAYTARLKRIVEEINRNHDVEGLCKGYLTRIAKLVDKNGGRLSE